MDHQEPLDLSQFLLGSAVASTSRKRMPETDQGGPLDLRTKRCKLRENGAFDAFSIGPLPDLVPVESRFYRKDPTIFASSSLSLPNASPNIVRAGREEHHNWSSQFIRGRIEPTRVFPSYQNVQKLVESDNRRVFNAPMSSVVSTDTANLSTWFGRNVEMSHAIPRHCDTASTVRNTSADMLPMPRMQQSTIFSTRDSVQPVLRLPTYTAMPAVFDIFDTNILPPLLSINDIGNDQLSSLFSIGNGVKDHQSIYSNPELSTLRFVNNDIRLQHNESNSVNRQQILVPPRSRQQSDNYQFFTNAGKVPFVIDKKGLSTDYTSMTSRSLYPYGEASNKRISHTWYVPSTTSCLQTNKATTAATAVPFPTNTSTTTAQHFVHPIPNPLSASYSTQTSVVKRLNNSGSQLPIGFLTEPAYRSRERLMLTSNSNRSSANANQADDCIVIDDDDDETSDNNCSIPTSSATEIESWSRVECTSTSIASNVIGRVVSDGIMGVKKSSSQSSMFDDLCKQSSFNKHKFASESNLTNTGLNATIISSHMKKRLSLLSLQSSVEVISNERDMLGAASTVSCNISDGLSSITGTAQPELKSSGITDSIHKSKSSLLRNDKVLTVPTNKSSSMDRELNNAGMDSNLSVNDAADVTTILLIPSVGSSISDAAKSSSQSAHYSVSGVVPRQDSLESIMPVLCSTSDAAVTLHRRQNDVAATADAYKPDFKLQIHNDLTETACLHASTSRNQLNLLSTNDKCMDGNIEDVSKKSTMNKGNCEEKAVSELMSDKPDSPDLSISVKHCVARDTIAANVTEDENRGKIKTRNKAVPGSAANKTKTLKTRGLKNVMDSSKPLNDESRLSLEKKMKKASDCGCVKLANIDCHDDDDIVKLTSKKGANTACIPLSRRSRMHLKSNLEPVKLRKRTHSFFYKDMAYDAELEKDAQRRLLVNICKRRKSRQKELACDGGSDSPTKTAAVLEPQQRVLRSSRPSTQQLRRKDASQSQSVADNDTDATICESEDEPSSAKPSCATHYLSNSSLNAASYSLRTRKQQSSFNSSMRRRGLRMKTNPSRNTNDIKTPERTKRSTSVDKHDTSNAIDKLSAWSRRSGRREAKLHAVESIQSVLDRSSDCIVGAGKTLTGKTLRQQRNKKDRDSSNRQTENINLTKALVGDKSCGDSQVSVVTDFIACIPDMEAVVEVELVQPTEDEASSSQQLESVACSSTPMKPPSVIRRRRAKPRDYLQDIRIKKLMRRRRQLAREEAEAAANDGDDSEGSDKVKQVKEGSNTSLTPDSKRVAISRKTGETLLHKTARLEYMDNMLQCLQSTDCDVNCRDHAGYTPLHESAISGNADIIRVLLAHGAHVNAAAQDGIRPIHDAVDNDNEEAVRVLLSAGADPTLASYSGHTCFGLAKTLAMKKLLHGHACDLNGWTTLLESESRKSSQKIELELPWHFTFENTRLDDDMFSDVPACDSDEHRLAFEFSDKPPLPLYKLPLITSDNQGSFYLLEDVLERVHITRSQLKMLHPMINIVLASHHAIVCNSSLRTIDNDIDEENYSDALPGGHKGSQDTLLSVCGGSQGTTAEGFRGSQDTVSGVCGGDTFSGVRRSSQDTVPGVCRGAEDTAMDVPSGLLIIATARLNQNTANSVFTDSNTPGAALQPNAAEHCESFDSNRLKVIVNELHIELGGERSVPLSSSNSPTLQRTSLRLLRSGQNSLEQSSPTAGRDTLLPAGGSVAVMEKTFPRRQSVRQQNKSPGANANSNDMAIALQCDKAVEDASVSVACTDCHVILTSAAEAATHRCRGRSIPPHSNSNSGEMMREFVQVDSRLKRLLGVSTEILTNDNDRNLYCIDAVPSTADPVFIAQDNVVVQPEFPSIIISDVTSLQSATAWGSLVEHTWHTASYPPTQSASASNVSTTVSSNHMSMPEPSTCSISAVHNSCISNVSTVEVVSAKNVSTSQAAVSTSIVSVLSTLDCIPTIPGLAGNNSSLSISMQSSSCPSVQAVSMYSPPAVRAVARRPSSRLKSSMSPVVLHDTRMSASAVDEDMMRYRVASLGHADLRQTSPGVPCIDLPVLEMHGDSVLSVLRVCCDTEQELNTSDDMEMPQLTAAFTPQ